MGIRNGARWLPGQLASIAQQDDVSWSLLASDDGSKDDGPEIVGNFGQKRTNVVEVIDGPRAGASRNYLWLLSQAKSGQFTALSDQDDIWMPGRLRRATKMLGDPRIAEPRIYASRTWEVGYQGGGKRLSRLHSNPPCFQNALVQNVLAGNTIVLNPAALNVVQSTLPKSTSVPFHDWWLYLILSAVGARVILDDQPTVFYRQHETNVIGAPSGVAAAARRIGGVLTAEYGTWLRENIAALAPHTDRFTQESEQAYRLFAKAMHGPLFLRARQLARSGARRQSRLGDLCVVGAAALGRI